MWAVLESERTAADLAVTRQWVKALAVLQQLVRDNPDTLDAWRRIGAIAFRAGRYEQAVAAQKQVAALTEADPQPHLASSEALLRLRKLDEARKEAKLAIDLAGESAAAAASAHDLLARIAFLRHDAETVRAEAAMARTADPGLPLPDYFEGRLLAEERHYDDALEAFKRATGDLGPAPHAREIPDLHYSAAETLRHLERDAEAEYELLEELKAFPQNTRAWSMLATLYRGAERTDEAEQAIAELLRVNPTPEGYAAAERLWTSFGQRQRAAALRTEASRQFDLH